MGNDLSTGRHGRASFIVGTVANQRLISLAHPDSTSWRVLALAPAAIRWVPQFVRYRNASK